jgi:hypothetical protein
VHWPCLVYEIPFVEESRQACDSRRCCVAVSGSADREKGGRNTAVAADVAQTEVADRNAAGLLLRWEVA